MLTTSQLINILNSYDTDQLIMLDGYEGGFVHLTSDQIIEKPVELFTNKQPWDGPHDIAEHTSQSFQTVVILSRYLYKKDKYK